MCGISGFNWQDEALIKRMNETTHHRGPDATGIFLANEISLGNNRLSIIDLDPSANQPMQSTDGRYVIVYNGEIYNFKELRKELAGYPFRTKSDTEVIIASYMFWGEKCVERFNGMFAFAIWDKQKHELFLARDHVGIKPLYYYHDDTCFIFSSEIKAILEHPIQRKIDIESLNHYFQLNYVPAPSTMFTNIKKFPTGSYGFFSNNLFSTTSYLGPNQFPREHTLDSRGVRMAVQEAVKSQLVSDKPVGVYLSGGIDSTVILASLKEAGVKDIDTFSTGFEVPANLEEKFNADFHLAGKTAKAFHTRHHEYLLPQSELPRLLEKAVWHMDEPIAVPTALSMIYLSSLAKEKVDVVINGKGGDELFGGYERYRLSRIASVYQKIIPNTLRKTLSFTETTRKLNITDQFKRYKMFMFQNQSTLPTFLKKDFNKQLITADYFKKMYFSHDHDPFETHFMYVDRNTWMPDQSLVLNDKMSMAGSVELRLPFLDRRVMALSDALPLSQKVSLLDNKIILKKAFEQEIPSYILSQPKRGWFSPGSFWLRNTPILDIAREAFQDDFYVGTKPLFEWSKVREYLREHEEKKGYHLPLLWPILVFQLWAKEFKVSI